MALFLRNIPAKCEAEILHSFLESKGLTDFEMDVPLFPDGKSRGFAVIRLRNSFAVQKSIRNIEGQFVPGFQRTTPLQLEPLKGKGPRRCFQSQTGLFKLRHPQKKVFPTASLDLKSLQTA